MLFGIKTEAGTQLTGYCDNVSNLMKEVGGGTCYDKIKSEIDANEAEKDARKWCESHRSDPKCKCVNVVEAGGTDFINFCKGKYDVYSGKPKARLLWFGFDNKADYLNISQIEVFTGEKDSDGNPVNILKDYDTSKVTVSSSYDTQGTYGPEKLFDGNYTSMYHSAGQANDYIQIDLGDLTTIEEIKIWNRQDCEQCFKRWDGAYVKLLNPFGEEIVRFK